MNGLYLFLAAVLVLTPLVALHEWGHYIVARLCGVKVLTYSIGMGPRLFGFTSKRTGIDYRVSLLPLGGYVKMLDEREGAVARHEKHLAFNNKHPLKKIAIVLAGPVMNFLIAIGLFFVLFLQPSEQLTTTIAKILPDTPAQHSGLQVGDTITNIDGKPMTTWQDINYALAGRMGETGAVSLAVDTAGTVKEYKVAIQQFMQGADKGKDPLHALGLLPWQPSLPPVIGQVLAGGAADAMGLQVGDRISTIDGTPIEDWTMISSIIQSAPDKWLTFGIIRDDRPMTLRIMPQAKVVAGQKQGQIGVMPATSEIVVPSNYKMTLTHTPSQALQHALQKTYDLSLMTIKVMGKMVSGAIGLDNLSGPITIAEVSKQSITMGLSQVLYTAALISLSLAVLNLLPIPVLDGGHIVYALIELIQGRSLSEKVQMIGLNIGMVLMLGLMLIAISNDVTRLFG